VAKRNGSNSISYWGTYATPADLPNLATAAYQTPQLEAGDFAYATSDTSLWVCTNATLGAAVWSQIPASPGPSASRYYDLVVGNATEGDTLGNCDYLDTGNGEQLIAALVAAGAASPPKSVFLRRGLYDRGAAGSSGAPVVVPTGVLLVGDGVSAVTIKSAANPAANATKTIQALVITGAGSQVWDVSISVPDLTSAEAAGKTSIVDVGEDGLFQNCDITIAAQSNATRMGTVRSAVNLQQGSTARDVIVTGAPDFAGDGTTYFANIWVTPKLGGSDVPTHIQQCRTTVGGVGIWVDGCSYVEMDAPHVIDPTYIGVYVTPPLTTAVQIDTLVVTWSAGASSQRFGIFVEASLALGNVDSVHVTGGYIDCFSDGVFGSVGVYLFANGGGSVTYCQFTTLDIRNFDEAARVDKSGGGGAASNGIINSRISGSSSGINNLVDPAFRSTGNY